MARRKLIKVNEPDPVVDVITNYSWTVSKSQAAKNEVPRIIISEYQPNVSSITQGTLYWAHQFNTIRESLENGRDISDLKTADPYEKLYSVSDSESGNSYTFPFYSDYHHAITNSWGENKGIVGSTTKGALDAITTGSRAVFPSAGIEQAKSWEGTTPAQYQFSFQLLNTVASDDIQKNQKLIKSLINNNLLDKMDFLVVRPPAICEVEIPGIRGRTVAVMNTINIQNLGQMNYIQKQNVPDAYLITITIQELLTESRQIFAGEIGKVVTRIDNPIQSIEEAADAGGELGNILREL